MSPVHLADRDSGTPNSGTTSLSTLSTTAIKDGHRGTGFPHAGQGHRHSASSNTLEAERADRISRLAGLERVSTVRPNQGATGSSTGGNPVVGQTSGYFDGGSNPAYATKLSTVGSASASTGGRTTTWASGSAKGQTEADEDDTEGDQMSMDANMDDRDRYSASAMDEDMDGDSISDSTSLVGFGEGASSTVSGPTYSRSNMVPRSGLANQWQGSNPSTPLSGSTPAAVEQQKREARMIDGLADDTASGYVDTAARGGVPVGTGSTGVETAERIMKDRLDGGESKKAPLGSPDEAGLGKFYFEEKK